MIVTKSVFGFSLVVLLVSTVACGRRDVDVLSTTTAPTPTPTNPSSGSNGSTGSTPSTGSTTPHPQTVDVVGRVAAVSGTCPSLLFAIDSVTITTTASTTFTGITCAQIVNGSSVVVQGVRQTDASVAATSVSAGNTK